MGVALLSPFLYADLCAQGSLIAPFEWTVAGPNSYWALWREGAAMPRFVRWVEQELAQAQPHAAPTGSPLA